MNLTHNNIPIDYITGAMLAGYFIFVIPNDSASESYQHLWNAFQAVTADNWCMDMSGQKVCCKAFIEDFTTTGPHAFVAIQKIEDK